MSSNKFAYTFVTHQDRETMTMIPSPYIKYRALATCTGRRGRDLCRSMRGKPSGKTGESFHMTPRHAEKCHALFCAGFEAVF